MINQIIDSSIIFYLYNEYNYSHGDISSDIMKILANLINNSIFILNKDEINIMKNFTDKAIYYSSTFKSLNFNDINKKGFHPIPSYFKSNNVNNFNSDYHAVLFCIDTKEEDRSYDVYYMNSGFGSEYHNSLVDYTFKNEAILKFSNITKETMIYFLEFLQNIDEIYQIYHIILPLLEDNSIYPKHNRLEFIKSSLKTENAYLETQKVGSCAYRSCIMIYYIYLVIIKNYPKTFFDDFINILRLNTTLEFNNNFKLEYINIFYFIKENITDFFNKIYSDNQQFNELLNKTKNSFYTVNNFINKLNLINPIKINNKLILKYEEQPIKESNIIQINDYFNNLPLTNYENIITSPFRIISYYKSFNILSLYSFNYNVDYNIEFIYTKIYLTDYENRKYLDLFIKTDYLTSHLYYYVYRMNLLLKLVCKRLNIEPKYEKTVKVINSLLSKKKIINYSNYETNKRLFNNLINDGLYLDVLDDITSLYKKIFPFINIDKFNRDNYRNKNYKVKEYINYEEIKAIYIYTIPNYRKLTDIIINYILAMINYDDKKDLNEILNNFREISDIYECNDLIIINKEWDILNGDYSNYIKICERKNNNLIFSENFEINIKNILSVKNMQNLFNMIQKGILISNNILTDLGDKILEKILDCAILKKYNDIVKDIQFDVLKNIKVFFNYLSDDEIISNQFNLSFLCRDIILDPFSELRINYNYDDLFPNHYLLDVYKNNSNIIGDEFNVLSYKDDLLNNINSVNMSNLLLALKQIETKDICIDLDEKLDIITLYIYHKLLYNKDVSDIDIDSFINLLQNIYKKNNKKTDIIKTLKNIYNLKSIDISNFRIDINFTEYIENLIYPNINHKLHISLIYLIYDKLYEIRSVLSDLTLFNKYASNFINKIESITNIKLIRNDSVEIEKIIKQYKVDNLIISNRSFDINNRKFSYDYTLNNKLKIKIDNKIILDNNNSNIPLSILDNFIIYKDRNNYIYEKLIDSTFNLELYDFIKTKFKDETNTELEWNLIYDKFIYYALDTDILTFNNNNKYLSYYPNTGYIILYNGNNYYLYIDDKYYEILNFKNIMYFNLNNILLIKKDNKYLIKFTFFYENNKPIIYYDINTKFKFYGRNEDLRYFYDDFQNDKNVYRKYNIDKYEVITLEINNNIIYFNLLDEALKLGYITSLCCNFHLCSLAYDYIKENITLSQLPKYNEYLVGYYPYYKIFFDALKNDTLKISQDDIINYIIVNRNTPNSKKLPKSYFDMVYSNNFNYTYKHYKCSHSGLINLENINEIWYNSLFIPNTLINVNNPDDYNSSMFKDNLDKNTILLNFVLRNTIDNNRYFNNNEKNIFKLDENVYKLVLKIDRQKYNDYYEEKKAVMNVIDPGIQIKHNIFKFIDLDKYFYDTFDYKPYLNTIKKDYYVFIDNKIDEFKRYIGSHIINKLKLINKDITKTKSYKNILLKTMIFKYESDLYELNNNLEENISLYIKNLELRPGYYKYGSVSTLVLYFDYYFNEQERKINPNFGSFIRPEQYDLIISILDNECNLRHNHKFYQLLMGSGKSSYIAPLLSLLLISTGLYPIHVMPKTLVKSAIDNMKILEKFGIKNISKEINRSNFYSFNEIIGSNEYNINLIMSDASMKAILLNNIQSNDILLIKNIQSKLKKAFIIFDEVDEISDPFKCELNYPDSSFKKDVSYITEKIELYTEILKCFYIDDFIIDDYEQKDIKDIIIYSLKTEMNDMIKQKIFMKFKDKFETIITKWLEILIEIDILLDKNKFQEKMKSENKSFDKFFILYNFMFDILPFVLVSRNRRDYGLFDLNGYKRDKINLIAIPFSAIESPNIQSEFSSTDLTIALTIASYLSNKNILREGDYDFLLNSYYNTYLELGDNWDTSSIKQNYLDIVKSLTDRDIDDIKNYRTYKSLATISNKNYQLKIFKEYIYSIIKNNIKIYEYQLNTTFCDIVSSDFCLNRTGFTGTPYFQSPYDRTPNKTLVKFPEKQKIAEESIDNSVLEEKTEIFIINGIDDIFDKLRTNKYNVLIDVGAYFVGINSIDIIRKIKEIVNNIDYIIYVDNNDIKKVYYNNEHYDLDKIEINKDRTFIYFDQKHIIGFDIKQIRINSIGLITIRYNNSIRDYSQGAFRLRKINITQYVDICIDKTINTTDKSKLLDYLKKREDMNMKNKYSLQSLHNIRTIMRYQLLENNITRLTANNNNLGINIFMLKSSLDIPNTLINLNDFTLENINIDEAKNMINYIQYYGIDDNLKIIIDKLIKNLNSNIKIEDKQQEIEQVIEQESEIIIEQQSQKLKNILSIYADKFASITKSYNINDIIDFNDSEDILEYKGSTFINFGFNKQICFSKLFLYRYFYKKDKILYVFNMIKIKDTYLIITHEEYTQFKSLNSEIREIDYSEIREPGFKSLLYYLTDKNLNNNNDMIYLIDSYISDFPRFKELIYNNDKLKINEKFIWKLILSKENIKDLKIINYSYYIYKLSSNDNIPYNYKEYDNYINKDLIEPFLRILSMDITLNDLLDNKIDKPFKELTNNFKSIKDLVLKSLLNNDLEHDIKIYMKIINRLLEYNGLEKNKFTDTNIIKLTGSYIEKNRYYGLINIPEKIYYILDITTKIDDSIIKDLKYFEKIDKLSTEIYLSRKHYIYKTDINRSIYLLFINNYLIRNHKVILKDIIYIRRFINDINIRMSKNDYNLIKIITYNYNYSIFSNYYRDTLFDIILLSRLFGYKFNLIENGELKIINMREDINKDINKDITIEKIDDVYKLYIPINEIKEEPIKIEKIKEIGYTNITDYLYNNVERFIQDDKEFLELMYRNFDEVDKNKLNEIMKTKEIITLDGFRLRAKYKKINNFGNRLNKMIRLLKEDNKDLIQNYERIFSK